MRVHVVSTGFAPATKALCLASVRAQRSISSHRWRDAAVSEPEKTASQNLFEMLQSISADEDESDIVALVDLDDWLSDNLALSRVADAYKSCPTMMVTYGQYMLPTGQIGHCKDLDRGYRIRSQSWVTSHLKTFRAGMIKHLREDDFKVNGEWVHRGVDMATMFPLIELAGYDRAKFIPEVNYVYNYASSFEASADVRALAEERSMVEAIRAKTPRERVKW